MYGLKEEAEALRLVRSSSFPRSSDREEFLCERPELVVRPLFFAGGLMRVDFLDALDFFDVFDSLDALGAGGRFELRADFSVPFFFSRDVFRLDGLTRLDPLFFPVGFLSLSSIAMGPPYELHLGIMRSGQSAAPCVPSGTRSSRTKESRQRLNAVCN